MKVPNSNKKRRLVIAFFTMSFSEKMGYIYNELPKALSARGHEVHIVSSDTQNFYNSPIYESTYQSFLGPPVVDTGIKEIYNGVKLHRLPHKKFKTEIYLNGVGKKLKEIKPDIVQIFHIDAILTFQLAFWKKLRGYKFVNGNHVLLSVFPLDKEWSSKSPLFKIKWFIFHTVPGYFISLNTDLSVQPAKECQYIAEEYYGMKFNKYKYADLGVDTNSFRPLKNENAILTSFREKYNIDEDWFVCVYTGRFTDGKNPLVLAKAINELVKSGFNNIIGLFIGEGPQKNKIMSVQNCKVFPFVNATDLPFIYNLAKIAIWPQQESTSMLDAASCGIPIIVSDKVKIEDRYYGNGLIYRQGDPNDLAAKILNLYNDEKHRKQLGNAGRKKMVEKYSWESIAKKRETDYYKLMGVTAPSPKGKKS